MSAPDRLLPLKLVAMTAAMFGFAFSLIPLYDAFCELTGFGGRTNTAPVALVETDTGRTVTIQFTTTVNQLAPYDFAPAVNSMEVEVGKIYDATFVASNLTQAARVGQAIPSVVPNRAGEFFRKTECFCFNNQPFEGGETKEMPLVFMVDRGLPEYIDTITLSYTFFNIESAANSGT
ncbi:MAG: cytochrome c oxidase assembly protein [Pseudomonadota bacterium]